MAARRKTYGEAEEQARAMLAKARLEDPEEHFPYKRDAVQAVLDDDRPMGPGIPGQLDGAEDRSFEVADYMTEAIADASEAFVQAQEALLRDPSEESQAAYAAATDRLQAARLDHRANRGNEFTIGAAARRAG